jgi:MFS family permease
METSPNGLRRMPLRIAGVIGLASAVVYLAVVLGQEDTSSRPQAIFWFGVMLVAGLLAWFADRLEHRGRRSAMVAAGLFFVLGVFSSVVFAIVYLVSTLLSVAGFAATSPTGEGSSIEP